jgi:membrane dipeptidase
VNGFPVHVRWRVRADVYDAGPGLTELGRNICIEMCSHGIIPDITHATEEAIKEVFAIADANSPKRSVIASHGAPRGSNLIDFKLNLSEATIKGIRDREGVIGVIFFGHWLLPGSPKDVHGDIGTVLDAIQRIAEVAGTTSCIAIGSDLDGFIRPVEGLENVGKFRALEKELLKRFSTSEVRGILCDNALTTFSKGWGKSRGRR